MENEIIVYQCHVGGTYREEDGAMAEQSINAIYQAESEDAACEAAAKFLRARCNALGLAPAFAQVCKFCIRALDADGNSKSGAGFNFFEWKCDASPSPFEDLLYSTIVRKAHMR